MVKNLLKGIVRSVFYKILLHPSIRYSILFSAFQNFLAYSEREQIFQISMDFVSRSELDGDYLEFGVCEGNTFVTAFHCAKRSNAVNHKKNTMNSMMFYAFDSFEGLPEIKGIDAKGYRCFNKGEYFCSLDKFVKIISGKGVDMTKVITVPGWYDEVLNDATKKKLPLKKASIIFIDCDLYESTVSVLEFITDYLQNGTILIFDDYYCYRGDPNYGEQRAFREWLERNPTIKAIEYRKFGWHGNSFIINISKKILKSKR
jgi:O-methyltransferase